jgi:hypothetical protein
MFWMRLFGFLSLLLGFILIAGEVLMEGQLLSMGLVLVSIGAALFIFAALIKAIEGRK